jgi:hypothetical protein
MLGEFPKLLGRTFAIAFLYPTTIVSILGLWIFDSFSSVDVLGWFGSDLVVKTSAAGFAILLLSVSLLVLNRELYRLLEGYGDINPIRLFRFLEKIRFEDLSDEFAKVESELAVFDEKNETAPAALERRWTNLRRDLTEQFPDESEYLLPTAFGNTIRAFEMYPRVMYGIGGVVGWDRLLGVIPREYHELVEDAKSRVDFWINLGFLGFLLYVFYIYLDISSKNEPSSLLFAIVLLVCVVAPLRARSAAAGWGNLVKSAYDIYLPVLREKIEMEACCSREEEMKRWSSFSQAILFHLPEQLPARDKEIKASVRKESSC